MSILKASECKHGMRVRCVINDVEIKDAKISIDDDGTIHIVLNKDFDNDYADDFLGYKHSVAIYDDAGAPDILENITLLEPAKSTWDTLKKGDVLIDKYGDEQMVLARVEDLVFLSDYNAFNRYWATRTTQESPEEGYTIKQPVEKTKLTKKEIAEKLGVEVDNLEIID